MKEEKNPRERTILFGETDINPDTLETIVSETGQSANLENQNPDNLAILTQKDIKERISELSQLNAADYGFKNEDFWKNEFPKMEYDEGIKKLKEYLLRDIIPIKKEIKEQGYRSIISIAHTTTLKTVMPENEFIKNLENLGIIRHKSETGNVLAFFKNFQKYSPTSINITQLTNSNLETIYVIKSSEQKNTYFCTKKEKAQFYLDRFLKYVKRIM